MTAPCWKDLLPNHDQVAAMTPKQLERAAPAVENQAVNLSYGVAAIGNLLASAALDTSHDISAGKLSANLTDTGNRISGQRKRSKCGNLSAA